MYYHTLKLQCDNSLKYSNIRNNTFDTITVYNTTSLKFFFNICSEFGCHLSMASFPRISPHMTNVIVEL